MGCCASNPQTKKKPKAEARPHAPGEEMPPAQAIQEPKPPEPEAVAAERKNELAFAPRDATSITDQKVYEEYFLDCVLHREAEELKGMLKFNCR